jgi:hypothetical protein
LDLACSIRKHIVDVISQSVASTVLDSAGIGCCVEYAQVAFSSLERLFIKEKDSFSLALQQTSPDLVYKLRKTLFAFGIG